MDFLVFSDSSKKRMNKFVFSTVIKKTEFVRLFFGRIRGYQKSFRNYLTFNETKTLRVCGENSQIPNIPYIPPVQNSSCKKWSWMMNQKMHFLAIIGCKNRVENITFDIWGEDDAGLWNNGAKMFFKNFLNRIVLR